MIDQTFSELAIGDSRRSSGRTMTETDVVNFCMLTGNWLGLHCDVEFAKRTRFGQRVVQGSLIFSIVNAMMPFDAEVVEALYGVDRLRFVKPTFIGDTLHASTEIISLEPRTGGGLATVLLSAINQEDEVVMKCEFTLRIRDERLVEQRADT